MARLQIHTHHIQLPLHILITTLLSTTTAIHNLCPAANATVKPTGTATCSNDGAAQTAALYCMTDPLIGRCQQNFDQTSRCFAIWDLGTDFVDPGDTITAGLERCCLCENKGFNLNQSWGICDDCVTTMQHNLGVNPDSVVPWQNAHNGMDKFCQSGQPQDLTSFLQNWFEVWVTWGAAATSSPAPSGFKLDTCTTGTGTATSHSSTIQRASSTMPPSVSALSAAGIFNSSTAVGLLPSSTSGTVHTSTSGTTHASGTATTRASSSTHSLPPTPPALKITSTSSLSQTTTPPSIAQSQTENEISSTTSGPLTGMAAWRGVAPELQISLLLATGATIIAVWQAAAAGFDVPFGLAVAGAVVGAGVGVWVLALLVWAAVAVAVWVADVFLG